MTGGQLAISIPAPGYYSHWVESANRSSGTGGVTWHPDEASARAYAVAAFERAYRSWPEANRPVAARVRVELLAATDDLGPWGSLSQEQRSGYCKEHPWITNPMGDEG
jgi:hypothetical protein